MADNPIHGSSPHPTGTAFGYDPTTGQYVVVQTDSSGSVSTNGLASVTDNPIYGHSPHPAGTMFGYDPVTEKYVVLRVDSTGGLATSGGGIMPRGLFDDLTQYVLGDLVSYSGTSYLLYADAQIGTLPTDTSFWQVFATGGIGDVVGPATAVDSSFAAFDSTTGELIKDSGYSAASFAAALGADDNYLTDAEKTKLTGIAAGAEVNVQADWTQASSSDDSYIKNKPSLGTAAAANTGDFDASGAAAAVAGDLSTHVGLAGTNVHGLGSASTHDVADFDAADAASAVDGNLTTHKNLTGASAHGLGTISTQAASSVAITGGTIAGLTALKIRDTSAAYDVTLAATSSTTLTADRILTLDLANAARTLKLSGNSVLNQDVSTAGSPTFVSEVLGSASTLHAVGATLKVAGNVGTELSAHAASLSERSGVSLVRSRGTVGSETVVVSDDKTGFFGFKGYDGTNALLTALIEAYVDGTPSTGVMPQRIDFITGTTGANRTARLSISSTGALNILGNTLNGNNTAGGNLTLSATSHATKGSIILTDVMTAPTVNGVDLLTMQTAYDKIGVAPSVVWPAFVRSGVRTNPTTGTSVATGVPAYVTGFTGTAGNAILVEEPTTNLLTQDKATGGEVTLGTTAFEYWQDNGETRTYDTSKSRQGAGCIKYTTPGIVSTEGCCCAPTGISTGIPYAGRVSVYAPVGASMVMFAYCNSYTQVGNFVYFTGTGAWQDISDSIVIPAAGTTGGIAVATARTPQAITFYVDCFQFEQKSYSTSWQNPADGARGYEALSFNPTGILSPSVGTIAFRAYITPSTKLTGSDVMFFWHATSGNQNRISIGYSVASGGWYAITGDAAGNVSGTYFDAMSITGWHDFVLTWSSTLLQMYVDGVAGTGQSNPHIPSAIHTIAYIGNNATGYQCNSYLDDFAILNTQWSQVDISAFHARTTELPVDANTVYKLRFNGSLDPGKGTRITESWRLAGTDQIDGSKITFGASAITTTGTVSTGALLCGAITGTASLIAATGNEVAYQLNYTTNKASSGNDTGLVINQTDTLSPGTSLLLDCQVASVSKFNVSNTGTLTTLNLTLTGANSSIFMAGTDCGVYGNTTDGTDNAVVRLCSGSSPYSIRGALINVYGNEHATYPGIVYFGRGAVAGNFGFHTQTFGTNAVGAIAILTGTAPTAGVADIVHFYSKDFAAGNACPTFMSENNTEIMLNQSLTTTSSPTFAGLTYTKGISTPATITLAHTGVAIPITSSNVEVTTDGDSDLDAGTLAAGTVGQIINIYCKVVGNAAGSFKVTPATMLGGTKITFGASPLGKGCTMVYTASGWLVVGNNGGTIA